MTPGRVGLVGRLVLVELVVLLVVLLVLLVVLLLEVLLVVVLLVGLVEEELDVVDAEELTLVDEVLGVEPDDRDSCQDMSRCCAWS